MRILPWLVTVIVLSVALALFLRRGDVAAGDAKTPADGVDGAPPTAEATGGHALTPGASRAAASERLAAGVASEVAPTAARGRVVDERGEPVAMFRLTARFRPEGGGRYEDRELGVFADGEFVVPELAPGRWKIRADADAHSPSRQESVRVTSEPGEPEVLELTLTRLAGLAGRVLDPFGVPVAGATVATGRSAASKEARSDESGEFALELQPGEFEVVARHDALASSATRKGTLAPGERLAVDLRLARGGRLEGEILTRGGDPRAGWWLQVTATDWRLDRPTVQADERGFFVCEHLATGTYMVNAVEKEDERPGMKPVRAIVEIEEGQTTHVVLGKKSENEVAIRGRVLLRGEPSAERFVWTLHEGRTSFASGQTARTDEDGQFELAVPEHGPVMILVGLGGLEGDPGAGTTTFHFDLPREPVFDCELELPLGRLSGLVLGADGEPAKRKVVKCAPEGDDPITTKFRSRTTKTDADGAFALDYLTEGTYRLQLLSAAGPGASLDGVRLAAGQERGGLVLRFAPAGKAEVRIVDAEGSPIQGATVYAHDAIGRAYGIGRGLTSGDDGSATFKNLVAGDYRFFARKEGLASARGELRGVVAGETVEVPLTLEAAGLFYVTLEDADGAPLKAQLTVLDETGRDFAHIFDGVDFRRYLSEGYSSTTRRIGPVPAGEYTVLAEFEDGRRKEGRVTVVAGEELELRLRLE